MYFQFCLTVINMWAEDSHREYIEEELNILNKLILESVLVKIVFKIIIICLFPIK